MSISIAELKKLEKDSYELLDIRSEVEISHGAIPGAIAVKPEEIEKKLKNKELDPEKKQVICCSRGKISIEIAEELEEEGYNAESLEGGYVAWLMDVMKEEMDKDQNNEKAKEVEQSLRKKFKKKIIVNVSKKYTSTKIIFNKKLSKTYVKIRPYKKIKGKKTYGRWVKTIGNRIY